MEVSSSEANGAHTAPHAAPKHFDLKLQPSPNDLDLNLPNLERPELIENGARELLYTTSLIP